MNPFLHDKLFEVNSSLKIGINYIDKMPLIVIDNIFKNFNEIRNVILNTPVGNWKYDSLGFNYKDYYDCRICFPAIQKELYKLTNEIISKSLNVNTKIYEGLHINWFKQINEKRSNYAFPHIDQYDNNLTFTCLIYLNNQNESLGGTGFFKNKITGNVDSTKNNEFLNKYPDAIENGYDYWSPEKYWDLIAFADMIPNRMIIFPANYYHAAYHPKNGFYENPRLTIAYWMKQI